MDARDIGLTESTPVSIIEDEEAEGDEEVDSMGGTGNAVEEKLGEGVTPLNEEEVDAFE